MLRGLDDPDEDYLARGDGAVGIPGHKVADVRYLVGYSYPACEEHDGSV